MRFNLHSEIHIVSQTKPITYATNGFWAYDVAVGVFLKYLIDAAQKSTEAHSAWLSEAVSEWQVQAVVSDFLLSLDSGWSTEQEQLFIDLAEEACTALAARDSIPADEIVNWQFVDDQYIDIRGAKEVFTAPVAELGRALVALIRGTLPKPPKGEAWFFGRPEGRSTIPMNPSWDGKW